MRVAVFAQVMPAQGFGHDIVPDPSVPKWVPLLAITGLLALTVGVAAIRIATYKEPARRR